MDAYNLASCVRVGCLVLRTILAYQRLDLRYAPVRTCLLCLLCQLHLCCTHQTTVIRNGLLASCVRPLSDHT